MASIIVLGGKFQASFLVSEVQISPRSLIKASDLTASFYN